MRALSSCRAAAGARLIVYRNRIKSNAAARKTPQLVEVDRIQQVADDVELLRGATAEIKAELDRIAGDLEFRANRQRAWIIVLVGWNVALTIALVVAVILLRRR